MLPLSHLFINPLNAELNLIRHLLALAGAHHFVHVSRIRVKTKFILSDPKFLQLQGVMIFGEIS
jgi:hypothetical protein